ncbi:uncharacterized protein [Apostichopus japonicus]|uniref:uncharacterized protein n=1 Tax=Stichopus japonicus TaxID=307972 RepID=UPI003AB72EBD
MDPENSHETQQSLSAVSIKLPPYWPNDPIIWFAQVEAQFVTRRVTNEDTKYSYVISSLQPEIAQEVRDLLISKPSEQPYKKLKEELIKRTTASEQKRLHQLLISEELGDRKPTQLLRKMRQLLGTNTLHANILKQLFVQRLPSSAQLILASMSDTTPIETVAELADKIMEVTPAYPPIAAIQTSQAQAQKSEVQQLSEQVRELTAQIASLKSEVRERSRSRSRSRQRFNSQSNNTSNVDSDICWYHQSFGDKARKCRAPCKYPSNLKPENEQASV